MNAEFNLTVASVKKEDTTSVYVKKLKNLSKLKMRYRLQSVQSMLMKVKFT